MFILNRDSLSCSQQERIENLLLDIPRLRKHVGMSVSERFLKRMPNEEECGVQQKRKLKAFTFNAFNLVGHMYAVKVRVSIAIKS